MKTSFTVLLFIVFILILTLSPNLPAQIVIQNNEYDIGFGTKHNLFFAEDTLGEGFDVNVGTTGGPQTWTFTLDQFPGGYSNESTVVDPATTPYADTFPESDHAWLYDEESDTVSLIQYYNLTESALYYLGMIIVSDSGTFGTVADPYEQVISFPAQMGASWTNNYSESYDFFGILITDSTSSVSTIDAWGTINIPAGSFECLRIREEETNITTMELIGLPPASDTTTYINYTWIGKEYGLLANLVSGPDETDPEYTKAYDVTIRTGIETAIEEPYMEITETFDLLHNYPNPFNPVTTISYNLTEPADVTLTIYNAVGQEISVLIHEKQEAGKHSVKWHAGGKPSGVYFCKLSANEQSSMRKMILIK